MPPARIHSIDAVRALALLGILLVHSHDRFNIWLPNLPSGSLDAAYDWLYSNFLLAKAFLVFSFLFGLSFFLQMHRAALRGIDYRARFCLRLGWLAVFGVIHSWFYCGDILTIFAVLGIVPVLFWRVPTRIIAIIAVLCFLQPVAIYNTVSGQPDALYRWYESVCAVLNLPSAPPAATAGFAEMGCWNVTCGVLHSFLYTLYTNRVWCIIGFFLTGILAGRAGIFSGNPQRLWRIAALAVAVYTGLLIFRETAMPSEMTLLTNLWLNETFVFAAVPLAAALLSRPRAERLLPPLFAVGRCTLTCYIMQSVVMLWIICGYGLGAGPQMSLTVYLTVALLLFTAQTAGSYFWLRKFAYGPLEGIWRRLTRIGM